MLLETRAQVEIAIPPEAVFDLATDLRMLPRFIRPYGPIPGVERAAMVAGAAPGVGAQREVVMTDGIVVVEEISAYKRPSLHRYRWASPPPALLAPIVRGADSEWCFLAAPRGDTTLLSWTYRFELTSPLAYPVAALLARLYRRWMLRGLTRLRAIAIRA